ncbi:hypothetical protein K435DRAFT_700746, partial [Dendrothele bispora CBS 962.96]
PYVYDAYIVVKERCLEMWEKLKEETKVTHHPVIKPFWANLVSNVDQEDQR